MILGGRKKWVGRIEERESVIEAVGRDFVMESCCCWVCSSDCAFWVSGV